MDPSNSTSQIVGKLQFSWLDYSFLGGMTLISVMIGIYFGCVSRKKNTIVEYMMGGKNMSILPISFSLVASFLSGMSTISVPSYVYLYGGSMWWFSLAILFVGPTVYYVYIPVYHKLQVMSIFEYLHLRFGVEVQMLLSVLKVLAIFVKLPISLYVPALILNQVTGLNEQFISASVCVVCVFYTTLGGFRAVVWTDTLQCVVLMAAMAVTMGIAVYLAGGIQQVFLTNYEGGRLNIFDFDPDPTKRTSFWSVFVGMFFTLVGFCAGDPSVIQKVNSLPSYSKIWKVMLLFVLGISIFETFTTITGFSLYALYKDCDPLRSGKINKIDQIVIHLVMDVSAYAIILPGIFLTGIMSSVLSSLSTFYNMIALMIYLDFVQPYMPSDMPESRANNIMKAIIVATGILSTFAVFFMKHVTNLLAFNLTFGGALNGTVLGAFSLGMLVPFANKKGCFCGMLASFVLMIWLTVGSQYYNTIGPNVMDQLPTSVSGCGNYTIANKTMEYTENIEIPYFYRISFFYYTLVGFATAMIVGSIASILTGGTKQKINRDLLSPVIHWMLPKEDCKYNTVEDAEKTLHVASE